MKKVLLISILVLTLILSCSCVEEITDESVPGLGPMETVTEPDAADPILGIDPDSIPENSDTTNPNASEDPTDPDDDEDATNPSGDDEPTDPTDPDNGDEPNDPETNPPSSTITLDNGAGTDNKAVTTALSGYPSNDETSAEGKVIKISQNGNTTVYRVQYVRTLTYIVEVTTFSDSITVDVYLEHYRLNMGADKEVKITIGKFSGKATTAELKWENNTPAKTLLMSATAPKGDADTVKIEADMYFGGTYHKEKIDNMELSVDLALN